MKKIAIIGSRTFSNYYELEEYILERIELRQISLIISGGAIGADKLAERFAKEHAKKIQVFYPDWKTYGKSAGYKRNVDIVTSADIVFAFWDGLSRGTSLSITIAQQFNKELYIKPIK